MSAEFKGVQLQIDPDGRLAAAAGGIARYFAESAGVTTEAAVELQKSIIAACQESFEHLKGKHPHLNVIFSCFPDRIEVAMSFEGGEEPAIGLDSIAGFAQHLGGSGGMGGLDRVQYEAHQGLSVTRLTKYWRHAPRIA